MSKIETIGKRISTLKDEEVASFVIMPTDSNWKLYLLGGWLFLWSVSGCVVLFNYFTLTNTNIKLVVIMWLAFWAYFEFKIFKAFLFRKYGKEKIWIKGGKLFYWRDVAGRGKRLEFDKELIKDLELIEKKKSDFFASMNESFWVIAGESISFNYGAKPYRVGIQLPEEEARELLRRIKHELRSN
ncbi:MAG: hypothetical protein ACXVC6_11215 [Bacteroidia bacterium]